MNSSIKRIIISTCSFLAIAGSAAAADLDSPIFQHQAPEVVPVEIGNSWYLRGDIGYNFNGRINNESTSNAGVVIDNDYQNGIAYSAGVGYQYNNYLRFDATVERIFATEFQETTPVAARSICNGTALIEADSSIAPRSLDCYNRDTVSYNALSVMANAYVDLGTYVGFTPYIGGGLGVARVRWNETTNQTLCFTGTVAGEARYCGGSGAQANTYQENTGTVNEGSDMRLAYSLMAGVGYKVSKNVKLDLGYKYTAVGDADGVTHTNTLGSDLAKNGFSAHQVRAGFRYSLW